MKSHYLLMCLAFLVFVSSATNATQPAEVDIAEEVFKSRQAIRRGELDISVVIDMRTRNPNGFEAEKHQYKFFFQGEKIRADSVIRSQKKGKWYRMPERRIVAGNQYIFDSQGDRFAVVVGDTAKITGMAEDDLFDPRILGLVPCRDISLDQYGLEDAVRWLRGGEIVGEETDANGKTIWRVENKEEAGTAKQILRYALISPSMDYAVLKAEWANRSGDRLVVESEYKEFPGDVWFPEKVVYQNFREGTLYHQETTVVESAIFNKADTAPDRMFTLASLDLAPGTAVRKFGEKMIWDGGILVPDPRWAKEVLQKTKLTNIVLGWRGMILWGNAVLCAVLAALVFLRYRRRKLGGL